MTTTPSTPGGGLDRAASTPDPAPDPHPSHDPHGNHAGHDPHGGHGAHGGGHMHHVEQFRTLFWIMTVLAIPVVVTSPMFAGLVGYDVPTHGWTTWISPILGTVMYVWGGRPFLTGAVSEIRSRAPGMMLLIALAITVALVASWGATLGLVDHELDFWWELALLIVIMLLGHWIEMRSIAQTSSALDSLAELMPDEAERVVQHGSDETVEAVPPTELVVGDIVIVRPGGRVPADGEVVEGRAEMDESMITGESTLVTRTVGDPVVAGTVSADSAIRVRVTAVGADTALAGIQRLVSEAQNSKSRAQRLADRAAGWLFWFALGAAVLTAIAWTLAGRPDEAVVRVITVLVIACPHALGLAIPLVVAIATERAAKMGALITDRIALETLRNVDTVLFDKTGTLTEGKPVLRDVVAVSPWTRDVVLGYAAAAEHDSEHPLARAIVTGARADGLSIPLADEFTSAAALGVTAEVSGHRVAVGGPRMLREHGSADGAEARTAAGDRATAELDTAGATVLYVLVDDAVAGALALADDVRPESAEAVRELIARGIEPVMVTGDAPAVADRVAGQLGIDEVHAGVRPEDKESIVADLQGAGRTVAMVGDGVNDAPALARADVGIAIGAGTDVAISSADVVLAGSDPRVVVSAIELSRKAYQKMRQNLWWAAGYNLAAVPLAAGVLAPIGFVLPMSVGAILMSASTIIVALNAQLLRRADLGPGRGRG